MNNYNMHGGTEDDRVKAMERALKDHYEMSCWPIS